MVKVNFSDDSSRRLVKSGRIMTGRAKGSRGREEKQARPGRWASPEDSEINGSNLLFLAQSRTRLHSHSWRKSQS